MTWSHVYLTRRIFSTGVSMAKKQCAYAKSAWPQQGSQTCDNRQVIIITGMVTGSEINLNRIIPTWFCVFNDYCSTVEFVNLIL